MKKVFKKLLFKKKHIAKKLIEVLKVRPVRLTVKHCIDLINLIPPDISYHGLIVIMKSLKKLQTLNDLLKILAAKFYRSASVRTHYREIEKRFCCLCTTSLQT